MIIEQNKRRTMLTEYGPYMNLRYAVRDNTGMLEIWFSDETRAKEWWEKNKNRPTLREIRDGQRQALHRLLDNVPDLEEDLPFM